MGQCRSTLIERAVDRIKKCSKSSEFASEKLPDRGPRNVSGIDILMLRQRKIRGGFAFPLEREDQRMLINLEAVLVVTRADFSLDICCNS